MIQTCEHPHCANLFKQTRKPGPKRRRYCSPRCQKRMENRRNELKRRKAVDRRTTKCDWCGYEAWDMGQLALDHITPKSQGGSDDDENVQTLCHNCHAFKTYVIDMSR